MDIYFGEKEVAKTFTRWILVSIPFKAGKCVVGWVVYDVSESTKVLC